MPHIAPAAPNTLLNNDAESSGRRGPEWALRETLRRLAAPSKGATPPSPSRWVLASVAECMVKTDGRVVRWSRRRMPRLPRRVSWVHVIRVHERRVIFRTWSSGQGSGRGCRPLTEG